MGAAVSDAVYDAGRQLLLDQMHDALTAAIPGQMPDQLRTYWTTGEGGTVKIRWGTDGSFERCERLLRKYFPRNPGGLCAKLHKRATGEWPAEKGIQSHAGPIADEADLEELLDGMAVGDELEIELAFDPNQPRAADGKWGGGGAKDPAQQKTERGMSAADKGKHLSDAEFVEMVVEQERVDRGAAPTERYRKLRARWDAQLKKNPSALIEVASRTRKARAEALKKLPPKKKAPAAKAAPAKKAALALDAGPEAAYHLPGRHNQESHGNRVGKPGNVHAGSGLGLHIRTAAEKHGRGEIAEEPVHLEGLRNSIKRAQEKADAAKAARTPRGPKAPKPEGEPIADLTEKGADALRSIEKATGDRTSHIGPLPRPMDGGPNEHALDNLVRKGFIKRDYAKETENDYRRRITLTEKGRDALKALKAGGVPAGTAKPKVSKKEAERRRVLKGRYLVDNPYTGADVRRVLEPEERVRVDGKMIGLDAGRRPETNPNAATTSTLNSPDWHAAPGGWDAETIRELLDLHLINRYSRGGDRYPNSQDDSGSSQWWAHMTPQGRQYLADIHNQATQTVGLQADAGEDEAMQPDVDDLTAHAGHHDDHEVESMDAALSDLDGPDEYAESMLPRYTKWQGMLAPIGKPTGDRRIFEGGALSNRDLPLPLLWQELSDDGHKRSSVVGTIDELDHREDGSYGTGRFLDPDLFPDAAKAMALLKARVNGPSVDLDDVTYAMKNADGTPFDMGTFEAETLAGGDPAKPLLSVSAGRISAATLVSIPAFAEVAHTWTLTDEIDEDAFSQHLADDMEDCDDCGAPALAAAGYSGPPLAAFMPRELTGPTAPTIADDGVTVYGHLATWGTCHVGFQNACVTPPHSPANYAYFHTGEVTTAEGERLPVGRLVLGAPHADLAKGFRAAAQHYDDTGRVTALIRAYEDEFGIAFAGVMVHDLDAEARAQFAAMPLSGDWRRVGGNLELIGAISVPVPGFPVARSTGAQATALVAAGVLHSADAQPVDGQAPGTHTVTFTDVPPEVFRLLAGMGDADAVAAEVSGPDASADFAAQVERELAAVGDTINRERARLLDGLNPGE